MVNTYIQFGTRLNPQMIPAWGANPAQSKAKFSTENAFTNGGVKVRNSVAGHMVYGLTWSPSFTRDQLRPIMDYADGLYDTTDGVNLLFFIDPVAADKNVCPQAWAFPAQGARDAMPLISSPTTGPIRPTATATPANTLGYPVRSAVYTIAGTETAKKLYIPIPPGYVAWVGAMGSATGATGVQATPFTGAAAGTVVPLNLLAVTSSTRFTNSFASSSGFTGLELQIIIAAGTLTWSGTMVQILPTGVTPLTGGFMSGQGHSGCEFAGEPQQTPYNVAPGVENVGMTVALRETGDWL